MEEWRPVSGHEGIYEVSSLGRVRRIKPGTRGVGIIRGFEIKAGAGYLGFKLSDPSRPCGRRTAYIHRIVAEAFLGPCPEDCEVNHKDTNTRNNAADNLEYVSHPRNVEHAKENDLIPKGEDKWCAVLTEQDARTIFAEKGKTPYRTLAAMYGVAYGTIAAIMVGRSWKHLHLVGNFP